MQFQLNSEWQSILTEEIQKPYFGELLNSVDLEYQNHNCYPPKEF
ncbi:MAG: hypothetical protein RLZZ44_490, partial [Bacteroidota bacterium]